MRPTTRGTIMMRMRVRNRVRMMRMVIDGHSRRRECTMDHHVRRKRRISSWRK